MLYGYIILFGVMNPHAHGKSILVNFWFRHVKFHIDMQIQTILGQVVWQVLTTGGIYLGQTI